MVYTGGNNIISAFTGGVPVKAIYTYGQLVWPSSTPTPTEYYIRWEPSDISGTFTINGTTYHLEDYSGYFSDYSGIITSSAFKSLPITSLDTNASMINMWAFNNCSLLSSVLLNSVVEIGTGTFKSCDIRTLSLPRCRTIWADGFGTCSMLSSVNLPSCEILYTDAFWRCISLEYISLPVCREIRTEAFYRCNITSISLPSCKNIWNRVFSNCSRLSTIFLGYSSVCSLGEDVFSDTLITSSTGSIYVPSSLVSDYKVADNWSEYASVIYPIPN